MSTLLLLPLMGPSLAPAIRFPPRTRPPCAAATIGTYSGAASALEVLYDSKCMVCLTNKAILNWFDRRKSLQFVDIRSSSYDPVLHGGVSYEDAMQHMHVRPQIDTC